MQEFIDSLRFNAQLPSLTYSNIPGPRISIERLLKQKTCFVRYASIQSPRNKKIVLNLRHYEVQDKDLIIFKIQLLHLLQLGFEIYHPDTTSCNYGEFKPLDPESILHAKFHINTDLIVDDDYCAEQLKCTGDELYIINSDNAEKLFIPPSINYYKANDKQELDLNTCALDLKGFLQLLTTNSSCKKLTLGVCRFWLESTNNIDDIPELPNLEVLEIDLSLGNCTVSIEFIQKIIEKSSALHTLHFIFDKYRIRGCLESFLQCVLNKNLTSIIIRDNNQNSLIPLRIKGPFPELRNIEILDINVLVLDDLTQSLPNAKNLTKINIYEIKSFEFISNFPLLKSIESECLNIKDFSFPMNEQLEILSFQSTNLNSEHINKLLENAPNLKTFIAQTVNPGKKSEQNILISQPLPALEELSLFSLKRITISSDGFVSLLTQAPALKKLTLYVPGDIKDKTVISKALPALEKLDLRVSTISSDVLVSLLAQAPALKNLTLLVSDFPDNIEIVQDLSVLEDLELVATNISSEVLGSLLSKMPNLKKLRLANCDNISGVIRIEQDFGALEDLDLSHSAISSDGLGSLLSKTPNLKKLSLERCDNISGVIRIEQDLEALEYLDLSRSDITSTNLGALLNKTPNIEVLKLNLSRGSESIALNSDLVKMKALYGVGSYEDSVFYSLSSKMPNLELSEQKSQPKTFEQLHNHLPEEQQYNRNKVSREEVSSRSEDPPPQKNDAMHTAIKNSSICAIDACTEEKKYNFQVKSDFKDSKGNVIAPNAVRYNCYNQLELSDGDNPFILSSDIVIENSLSDCNAIKMDTAHHFDNLNSSQYLGRFKINMSKDWQPLPSLDPNEELISYYTDSDNVEIKYCVENNFYYISSKACQDVFVEILVEKKPVEPLVLDYVTKDLLTQIKSYTAGKLTGDLTNGKACIDAILEQKKGACRHRAIACMYLLQQKRIPVRIVTNDCHSFVEIQSNGVWHIEDLGFYAANLEQAEFLFDKNLEPKPENHPLKVVDDEKDFLFRILNSSEKRILVNTDNVQAMRTALQAIANSISKNFIYVDNYEELRCQGPFIRRNEDMTGEIIEGCGGPLYNFLTSAEHPIILLNLSSFFEDNVVVKYNSIFDEECRIDGIEFNNVKIIAVCDKKTQDESIKSRFDMIISRNVARKNITVNHRYSYVIECCGGYNWESRLVGSWIIGTDNKLTYKKGELWQAIENGNSSIELNNPPVNDKKFMRFIEDMKFYQGIFIENKLECSVEKLFIKNTHNNQILGIENRLKPGNFEDDFHILNPVTLDDFLGKYQYCEETKSIGYDAGLVANTTQELNVVLTASLSIEQWRLLVLSCQEHNKMLNIKKAPVVAIPQQFNIDFGEYTLIKDNQLIQDKEMVRIDISELSPEDLLPTIVKTSGESLLNIKFAKVPGFLMNTLASGANVVLTGDWAKARDLAWSLHSFIIKYGSQIIIENGGEYFPFMENYEVTKNIVQVSEEVRLDKRLEKFNEMIAANKVLILTGPTGVGKTHFMKEHFPEAFHGEKNISEWIKSQKTDPILFIDEANMSHNEWTMFEGLFNASPGIFYNCQYHELSENHRVVFAANPESYGGERRLPMFFAHHPCYLKFLPLDSSEMLASLKIDFNYQSSIKEMIDKGQVKITPREIKMILAQIQEFGEQYHAAIAYDILAPHAPVGFSKFKPTKSIDLSDYTKKMKSLVVNDANRPAIEAICKQISVRTKPDRGLGGVVLEGEPGIGKSQLALTLLTEAFGLQEKEDFVRIPVSWVGQQREQALIDAYLKGQIVIIDEINAAPIGEILLNDLLDGSYKSVSDIKPGFMIIGTQNPASQKGRVATTEAILHRVQTVKLSSYSREQIIEILCHLGATPEQANTLYATEKGLRNLIRKLHHLLVSNKTEVNLTEPKINFCQHSFFKVNTLHVSSFIVGAIVGAVVGLFAFSGWYILACAVACAILLTIITAISARCCEKKQQGRAID